MRFEHIPIPAGSVFGRLTIVAHVGLDSKRFHVYSCRCSCGEAKIVRATSLRGGHVRSCGCLLAEYRKKIRVEMVGKKYGDLLVVAFAGHKKMPSQSQRMVLVRCGKGHERVVLASHVRQGAGCHTCWATSGDRTGKMVGISLVLLRDNERYLLECSKCSTRRTVGLHAIYGIERGDHRACLRCEDNPHDRMIEAQGKRQNMAAWARELGITRERIRQRIDIAGWPPDVAVTTPPLRTGPGRELLLRRRTA